MKQRDATGPQRATATVSREAAEGDRVIRWVLSDGSVDRAGDTLNPQGWELAAYRKNPTVLWAHDSSAPPIGRMVSTWSDGTRLMGDVEFAPADVYPFAEDVFRLIGAGYIKSGSVGFLPLDYRWADEDDRPWGVDFLKQELLEFSIVPVPCNANALMEARSKGLRTGVLRGTARPVLTTRAARRVREWAAEGRPATAAELVLVKARLDAVRRRHGLGDPWAEERAREAAAAAECKSRAATAARAYAVTMRNW